MTKSESQKPEEQKLGGKTLEQYVDLLRDGDNFEKEKAIDALTASPGRDSVEAVIPLLQQKNTGARMAVLDVLKKIGSSYIEGIIGMLYDENEDIRVYGCEVLSFLKDRRAIPDLIDKLKNDADNVRNAACVALGDFDDKEAVEALLNALHDDEWIAFSAIYSIGRTKHRNAVPRLMEIFKTGEEELSVAACEVLIEYDDNTILDDVFEALKSWDRAKRNTYLKIILEKGNEDIFQKLKEKIGDELYEHLLSNICNEKQYSLEAIRMLANFRHSDACEAILDVLKEMNSESEEYETIMELFASLSDVWAPSVDDYMKRDEMYLLPLIKACKIAGIKLREAELLSIFESAPVEAKREIMTGLPGLIQGDSCSIVRKAIRDTDGHIKGYAVDVVGVLLLGELKSEISEIVQNGFPDVRIKAIKTLILLDREQAMELVRQFVSSGSGNDKKVYLSAAHLITGEDNYPLIEKLISDEDESVRRNAISIISNFVDNKRYIDLIQKILMSDNVPHEVLKIIKDKKLDMFKNRLIELFTDKNKGMWTRYYALAALGVFEDATLFDIFVNGLGDENSLIIIGCIRALADLNGRRAVRYIRSFLSNDNEDVRSAAESVLEKIEGI